MEWTAVPVAPIDEYSNAGTQESQIGFARQSYPQSVTKPARVESAAQHQLWHRVPRAHSLHRSPALLGCENVGARQLVQGDVAGGARSVQRKWVTHLLVGSWRTVTFWSEPSKTSV